ncbi:MAG: SDR family NAD(P)-dependent oxidoreductase [Gemmataceae bacterium]
MSFTNQVAVITGASSGIGWALARELARRGAKVGLIARRQDKLDELVELITKHGGQAAGAAADVAEREPTLAAFKSIAERLGPADLLIANAGVGWPTFLDPVNIEQVERMIRVNLLGAIYSIEAVLPAMLERQRGHIAAISSLAAYKGLPGESAYCASKAGLNAYMEGLRIHLRDRGIAVTTVCPGFVKTPMTDINEFKMPMLMEADEAARRIAAALARRKKVFNFPWPMMLLMRATRWLPDWLVARTFTEYDRQVTHQREQGKLPE